MKIRECVCDECEGYQEGLCIMDVLYKGFDIDECKCKSNADLMTEEEYEESLKLKL